MQIGLNQVKVIVIDCIKLIVTYRLIFSKLSQKINEYIQNYSENYQLTRREKVNDTFFQTLQLEMTFHRN